MGASFYLIVALNGLGGLARRQGKLKESLEYYHRAIKLIPESARVLALEYSLDELAKTVSDMGASEQAVRLLSAAASMRKKRGVVLHPVFRAEYDKYIALLREKLGDTTFENLWAEGEYMSIEQAIELASQEE